MKKEVKIGLIGILALAILIDIAIDSSSNSATPFLINLFIFKNPHLFCWIN